MKDGERGRPIKNYGKKEQKERLDNILPDPHPCTAGNKEEEHTHIYILLKITFIVQFIVYCISYNFLLDHSKIMK